MDGPQRRRRTEKCDGQPDDIRDARRKRRNQSRVRRRSEPDHRNRRRQRHGRSQPRVGHSRRNGYPDGNARRELLLPEMDGPQRRYRAGKSDGKPTTFTLPEGGGNIEIRAEFTDLLSLAASEIIAYDAEKAATVTRLSVGGNLTDRGNRRDLRQIPESSLPRTHRRQSHSRQFHVRCRLTRTETDQTRRAECAGGNVGRRECVSQQRPHRRQQFIAPHRSPSQGADHRRTGVQRPVDARRGCLPRTDRSGRIGLLAEQSAGQGGDAQTHLCSQLVILQLHRSHGDLDAQSRRGGQRLLLLRRSDEHLAAQTQDGRRVVFRLFDQTDANRHTQCGKAGEDGHVRLQRPAELQRRKSRVRRRPVLRKMLRPQGGFVPRGHGFREAAASSTANR